MTTCFTTGPSLKQFGFTGNILTETMKTKEIFDRMVAEAGKRQAEFDEQITSMTCPVCGRSPVILRGHVRFVLDSFRRNTFHTNIVHAKAPRRGENKSWIDDAIGVCKCMLEEIEKLCETREELKEAAEKQYAFTWHPLDSLRIEVLDERIHDALIAVGKRFACVGPTYEEP